MLNVHTSLKFFANIKKLFFPCAKNCSVNFCECKTLSKSFAEPSIKFKLYIHTNLHNLKVQKIKKYSLTILKRNSPKLRQSYNLLLDYINYFRNIKKLISSKG